MQIRKLGVIGVVVVGLVAGAGRTADAQFYAQRNLVSDGAVTADHVDPDLVNAWGLAAGPTTPWWVADNGTNVSTLYDSGGVKRALVVSVPGNPTGVVFNADTTAFVLSNAAMSAPARFIFATEGGQILAWAGTEVSGATARVVVDNSSAGAVYKGLAIAMTTMGTRLYATNFHEGTVEIYDSNFKPVSTAGAFTDSDLPPGYAPFGIQHIENLIYVTYALQDADRHDDVPGMGHGFIDAFDTSGNLMRRVASAGILNSPWGLAMSPSDFGKFSNALLVGNFGNGQIHAFDPNHILGNGEYAKVGPLHSTSGAPLVIDGLWSLQFGNGGPSGKVNTLFFTAGPDHESHGLFGSLTPATPQRR